MNKVNFIDSCILFFKKFRYYIFAYLLSLLVFNLFLLTFKICSFNIMLSFIILFLYLYINYFINPICVYKIQTDNKFNVKEIINLILIKSFKPNLTVLIQFLKFVGSLVLGTILLFGFFMSVFALSFDMTIIVSESFTPMLRIIFFILGMVILLGLLIGFLLIIIKMQTILELKILDHITEFNYYKNNKPEFKNIFVWNLIPGINLISPYSIGIMYVENAKKEE